MSDPEIDRRTFSLPVVQLIPVSKASFCNLVHTVTHRNRRQQRTRLSLPWALFRGLLANNSGTARAEPMSTMAMATTTTEYPCKLELTSAGSQQPVQFSFGELSFTFSGSSGSTCALSSSALSRFLTHIHDQRSAEGLRSFVSRNMGWNIWFRGRCACARRKTLGSRT